MINLTVKPAILAADNDLDKAIRASIKQVRDWLVLRHGTPPIKRTKKGEPNALWKAKKFAFLYATDAQTITKKPIGHAFIENVYAFVQNSPARHNKGGSQHLRAAMAAMGSSIFPPAHVWQEIRQGLCATLIALRCMGAIVLPLSFKAGSLLALRCFVTSYENEIMAFFRAFGANDYRRPAQLGALSAGELTRLGKVGPRLIWATDWHRFEDINVDEIGDAHFATQLSEERSNSNQVNLTPIPYHLMLAELVQNFGPRLSFSQEDVNAYAVWAMRSGISSKHTYREFREKGEIALTTPAVASEKAPSKKVPSDASKEMQGLATSGADDALLTYFEKVQIERGGTAWLARQATYPGRESAIDLPEMSKTWRRVINSWLKKRRDKKGYETQESALNGINILCDYLFLYLPWWSQLHPDAGVTVPQSPREFTRFPFIDQEDDEGDGLSDSPAYPKTLLDMVKVRRQTENSEYSAVVQIEKLFNYVAQRYANDDEIAGAGFRNPIQREWDLPTTRKAGKTNKIPFSKKTYPILLFFSYAVEAFGQYLQTIAVECNCGQFRPNDARQIDSYKVVETLKSFDTQSWGYVPLIFYRNKAYPVYHVPNVFEWAVRNIECDSRYCREVLAVSAHPTLRRMVFPHVSIMRMLIGAIETGLRVQHFQWQCRLRWDERNGDAPISSALDLLVNVPRGAYVYDLFVPTDKRKDGPFVTKMTFRLRGVLHREQLFQEAIAEPLMDEMLWYEKRKNSRFGKILPLFRSTSKPQPVEDSTYDRYWLTFLTGFEIHWNAFEPSPGNWVRFVKEKPKLDNHRNPVFKEVDGKRVPVYVVRAIHTPHACRVTFATNRQGELESSVISALLGQSGPIATSHYQVVLPEEMKRGLERSDNIAISHVNSSIDFDKNSPAHLRPDRSDSEFVRRVHQNRSAAINDFGVMSGRVHWALSEITENVPDEGLELFRNGPMSHLVFRETHVCPVGEQCPKEIIEALGGPMRCGQCKLACVHVDYLPAIGAKILYLNEVVKFGYARCAQLAAAGEPKAVIDAEFETVEANAKEYGFWKVRERLLREKYDARVAAGDAFPYVVGAPEIVNRHLELVTRECNAREFMIARLAQANAWPSMATPQNSIDAQNIRTGLLTMLGQGQSARLSGPVDELAQLASLIKTQIEPRGHTLQDVLQKAEEMRLGIGLEATTIRLLDDSGVSRVAGKQIRAKT